MRLNAPLAADTPRWVEVELTFAGRPREDGLPCELTVESVRYEP